MNAADLVRHYRAGMISRSELVVGCITALAPETLDATVAALAGVDAEREFWAALERAEACGGVARDGQGWPSTLTEGARAVLRRRRESPGAPGAGFVG